MKFPQRRPRALNGGRPAKEGGRKIAVFCRIELDVFKAVEELAETHGLSVGKLIERWIIAASGYREPEGEP